MTSFCSPCQKWMARAASAKSVSSSASVFSMVQFMCFLRPLGCVYGRWNQRQAHQHPQGRNVRGGASRLPLSQTLQGPAENKNQHERGKCRERRTSIRGGLKTIDAEGVADSPG